MVQTESQMSEWVWYYYSYHFVRKPERTLHVCENTMNNNNKGRCLPQHPRGGRLKYLQWPLEAEALYEGNTLAIKNVHLASSHPKQPSSISTSHNGQISCVFSPNVIYAPLALWQLQQFGLPWNTNSQVIHCFCLLKSDSLLCFQMWDPVLLLTRGLLDYSALPCSPWCGFSLSRALLFICNPFLGGIRDLICPWVCCWKRWLEVIIIKLSQSECFYVKVEILG